jgi:TPR repeat protein
MHFYGRGFAEDRPKGIEWYRKAAELGDAESQFMLGWCYRNGLTLPTDKVKALMWMTLSMDSFDESESGLRDRAYKEQQDLKDEMKPEQIRLAVELAEEWERKRE